MNSSMRTIPEQFINFLTILNLWNFARRILILYLLLLVSSFNFFFFCLPLKIFHDVLPLRSCKEIILSPLFNLVDKKLDAYQAAQFRIL